MAVPPSTFHPPATIKIVEVGPRDGLQNEHERVATADKIAFINHLSAAGHSFIEITAFVHPGRVPQMADASEVCAGITRYPNVTYSALVPNLVGLERAREADLRHIAVFAAASQTFSKRNINASIEESLQTYGAVCREAVSHGIRVRGYVSTSFGCPYEGAIKPMAVADVARRLLDVGVYEVAVSDTIGIAHPAQVWDVIEHLAGTIPLTSIALHFHDTRGTALANVLAGLQAGVQTFDASAGGLGGCPFAPGAAGNLATEDMIYMMDGLGIATGVRLVDQVRASRFIGARLSHPLPSRYLQAEGSSKQDGTNTKQTRQISDEIRRRTIEDR